jgi:AcrR family transcriptional regulator
MTRARPLDPEARRSHLLEAARTCFARRGYHPTSVSDILEEAGVARGTFYNHFASKRAVFQAVLGELTEGLATAARPIAVTGDIPEQVRQNVRRVVEAASAPWVARLLFADALGIDDDADEALRAFYGAAWERVNRALVLGQALGVVRPGNTEILARCVVGAVKEPIFHAALMGAPLDVDGVADEVYALLTRGLVRS